MCASIQLYSSYGSRSNYKINCLLLQNIKNNIFLSPSTVLSSGRERCAVFTVSVKSQLVDRDQNGVVAVNYAVAI